MSEKDYLNLLLLVLDQILPQNSNKNHFLKVEDSDSVVVGNSVWANSAAENSAEVHSAAESSAEAYLHVDLVEGVRVDLVACDQVVRL